MAFWLLKTEPSEFSIDDLQKLGKKSERWNGIRNYQARNIIRDQIKVNDLVMIYHSSCKQVGVAGIGKVESSAYADPDQFDPANRYYDPKATTESPRWFCFDVMFQQKFPRPVLLKAIKSNPALSEMLLVKQGRLSIQPVTSQQWQTICQMASESSSK